jgi:hypothetical protein
VAITPHQENPPVQARLVPDQPRVERPAWVWIAVALELFTALGAIPAGIMFLMDPTGRMIQVPQGWIEATFLGSYLVPGLYLVLVNGIGMLVLAGLTVRRHWIAPWLTGTLGVGMLIWILAEVVLLPETMFLTWIFLGVGLALGFVAPFWLRRTGQLRLW